MQANAPRTALAIAATINAIAGSVSPVFGMLDVVEDDEDWDGEDDVDVVVDEGVDEDVDVPTFSPVALFTA